MKKIYLMLPLIFALCIMSVKAQNNSNGGASYIVVKNEAPLSPGDQHLIENYNFDQYRFYNKRKQIQIENGPLLELLSIKEVLEKGAAVDAAIVNTAKNKDENFIHESIVLLKIGVGIIAAPEPK